MTVKSIQEAWDEVNKIFPYDYEKNETASKNAGYPIYYSTTSDHQNNWISDLGNRLEVNFEDGRSVNVWVNSEEYHHFEIKYLGVVPNNALRKDHITIWRVCNGCFKTIYTKLRNMPLLRKRTARRNGKYTNFHSSLTELHNGRFYR